MAVVTNTGLFDKGREEFLSGNINWTDNGSSYEMSVVLFDEDSDTSDASHPDDTWEDMADAKAAGGADGLVDEGIIQAASVAAGVVDGTDVTLSSVAAITGHGDAAAEWLIVFKDTGTDANDFLISYDEDATGLPVTPNSGDITITWDSGANKIFNWTG